MIIKNVFVHNTKCICISRDLTNDVNVLNIIIFLFSL